MTKDSESSDKPKYNLSHVSLGMNMAVGMIVCTYLGVWVGKKVGGLKWWTLGGIFLGLFFCGYEVWKIIRNTNQDNSQNNKK